MIVVYLIHFTSVRYAQQRRLRLMKTAGDSSKSDGVATLIIQAHSGSLDHLPNEILHLVLTFLAHEPKALLSCRVVCRHFQNCIDHSAALQLELKLSVWGYKLCCDRSISSPSELLHSLEAHIRSWRDLNWEQTKIDIPSSRGSAYDLAHGYFASVSRSSSFELVTVVELPASSRSRMQTSTGGGPNAPRVYSLPRVSFEIRDLAIDPSQDLLILEEM